MSATNRSIGKIITNFNRTRRCGFGPHDGHRYYGNSRKKLQRKFIGFDNSQVYMDIAKAKLEDVTPTNLPTLSYTQIGQTESSYTKTKHKHPQTYNERLIKIEKTKKKNLITSQYIQYNIQSL